MDNTIQPQAPHPKRVSSRKGRPVVSNALWLKALKLPPARYTSRQLALALDLPRHERWRIREWVRRGCPHRKTPTGRSLIEGDELRAWLQSARTKRKLAPLAPGTMFCTTCGCPQPYDADAVSYDTRGARARRIAPCPLGHRMSQFVPWSVIP